MTHVWQTQENLSSDTEKKICAYLGNACENLSVTNRQIAERIRDAIAKSGLDAKQVSLRAGWSANQISNVLRQLERGDGISLRTAQRISQALNVPAELLLGSAQAETAAPGARVDAMPHLDGYARPRALCRRDQTFLC